MITSNLFQRILIDPARQHYANLLLILSAHATANHARRHLKTLYQMNRHVQVKLILGMTVERGINDLQHTEFTDLCKSGPYNCGLECNYIVQGSPVHANLYIWLKDQQPIIAFLGSANYTRNGFSRFVREAMIEVAAKEALDHFYKIKEDSISCLDKDVEQVIFPLPFDEFAGLDRILT